MEPLLTDLINVELLQRFQDEFSCYTGIAALTTDAQGRPVTKGSGFTEFCFDYIRSSDEGVKRCMLCDKMCAKGAAETGEVFVHKCHAGLWDFAAPIMVEGNIIGCCLGGQVRTSEVDEEELSATAKSLKLDLEVLREAAQKTRLMKEEEIRKAAEFLKIMAGALSELAYQNYKALEKYQRLERAARSQARFLIDLSSELKEKMNCWMASLEESVKDGDIESVRNVIDTMLAGGNSNYSAMGDIVDYMRLSEGDIELYESTYRIKDVVQAVMDLEAESAKEKNIKVSYVAGEDVPEYLFGDGGRIGQILLKLVAGMIASKDEEDTESEIRIEIFVERIAYSGRLTIKVTDTDRGLSTEELEYLERFFSKSRLKLLEKDEDREYALSIVKMFVRQLNGEIRPENDGGKVTSFVIHLPQLVVDKKQGE